MPEQAQQAQQAQQRSSSLSQKPSAKRQKEPLAAIQMPSMQSMPAAATSHTHLPTLPVPAVEGAPPAGSSLLCPSAGHAFTVGGITHTQHVQQTMHQLNRVLSSTQAQQPDAVCLVPDPRPVDNVAIVTSDPRPVDSAAVVPAMPDIRYRPSPAGTAGPKMQPAQQQGGLQGIQGQQAFQPSSAGTSGLSIQAAQQQGGLHTTQGQQGSQAALADSPQQQSGVVHQPLAPDQTQSPTHLATGSNSVSCSSSEVKPEQDQLQQEADADRAGEATGDGAPARSKALSQLIARAKKLKDQLDAHARRKALR